MAPVYRPFGSTGRRVSPVSFGAWAIGGYWGKVYDSESEAALHRAVSMGVNLFDTADVYGDGHSEELIGQLPNRDRLFIATKAGRRLPKQETSGYTRENLVAWTERSRAKLRVRTIDLLQLHCPPPDLYKSPRVFRVLDDFVREGRIKNYGTSVETIEEAKLALDQPGVQSIQIIFNMFRQRPIEELFPLAQKRKVAIIARVPLASGLLTGRVTKARAFSADDHRNFNRNGEAFDVGETFSGVPLDIGLAAVEELKGILPKGWTLAQFALRWILMHDAVTTVIPGCKTAHQVEDNMKAADLPAIPAATMSAVREIYDRLILPHVATRW